CVSHDRYFLDRVVNRLLILEPPDMIDFNGAYSAWVQRQAEQSRARTQQAAEASRGKSKPTPPSPRPSKEKDAGRKKDNPYSRPFGRLDIKELEKQITETEIALAECQENIGSRAAARDPGRGHRLQAEFKALSDKLKG